MNNDLNALFVALVGLGGLLVVIGIIVFFWMRRPAGRALRAPGVVIDHEESHDEDGVTYSPIVRFTAHDGTDVTFTDLISSNPRLFKVGERVNVRYDPATFGVARIASFRSNLVSIVIILLGAIVGTVGLLLRS